MRPTVEDAFGYFKESYSFYTMFLNAESMMQVVRVADILIKAIQKKNKIIAAGNGGSLQDAGHFAEELTGRFYRDRPALPAVAINDPGHITCVANDYGFDYVFSKYLEAHGQRGDVFVGFTTSGNSKNILEALRVARRKRMLAVVLTGESGGEVVKQKLCKNVIRVPNSHAGNAQEIHIKIVHCLIYLIEKGLRYPTLEFES